MGDVRHSKLVPDAGGNVLNEKVPTSILSGPSLSRDQPSVSLSVPVGTTMECWGPAVEGVSGLTRRKKRRH